MSGSPLPLAIGNLDLAYGNVSALSDVSIHVAHSEVVAVLGPNGAGKSSLLRTVSGLERSQSGTVEVNGRRVERAGARRISRLGVAHVPEGRRVLAPLTVQENLEIAARAAGRRNRIGVREGFEEVYETFPVLRDRRRQASGLLSGGEQQMLAIGRGIMAKPEILLLDEPSMGLAPIVVDEIFELLASRRGTLGQSALLLAEQSVALAADLCSRAYVLSRGSVAFAGPIAELDDETMLAAYLGGRSASNGHGDCEGGGEPLREEQG